LTDGNSRCVAYLDSLSFQEGTPLAPIEEHSSTEVANTDSNLGTPDRQVLMAAGETLGPSGTQPDCYLDDISEDDLSANAPAGETNDDKNARCECNRKRNERRRRLCEALPIRNLSETLDQVANRVHTTPEQCLISITMIAHQAQGICVGEVITKLAENAYFMRVDNRVAQVPPFRTRESRHHEATSRSPADGGRNRYRGKQPQHPNRSKHQLEGLLRAATVRAAPAEATAAPAVATVAAEVAATGAPHTVRAGELVAAAIADSHVTGVSHDSYDARRRIEEIRHKKASEASDSDGFPAFSARLRDLLLP
jgi:hypothetical protein